MATKEQKERMELFDRRKDFVYKTYLEAKKLGIILIVNPKNGSFSWHQVEIKEHKGVQ